MVELAQLTQLPFDMPESYRSVTDTSTEEELDLALAAELQATLMPSQWQIDSHHYRAAALNRMCGRVGGDFCEFIRLNPDQVAAAIGDVTGRGVRASLLMARIMGFLRSRPQACSRPCEIVRLLNEMLLGLGDRLGAPVSCSLFYVVLDTPTGTAFFVNAGLPLPLLSDRNTGFSVQLGPVGQSLGVTDFEPAEGCHTFNASERLTICTDGVLNATNQRDEEFGVERLDTVLHNYTSTSARGCVRAVFDALDAYRQGARQRDDETVLVVDCSQTPAGCEYQI